MSQPSISGGQSGKSPRAIAKALNAEGTPGPDGRPWIDTTIRGQRDRGTGVLNNEAYVGRLVWNRVAYVKDPRTGRRKARPNPPGQWETNSVPHLRIVDQGLWDAVKRRQDELGFAISRDQAGNALNRAHRRRFLLSGMLVCGACGGGYTIVAKDRYGCATHRQKGTCGNDRTIARDAIEQRVLHGLKDRLLTPELFAEFSKGFHEEVNRAARERDAARLQARQQLTEVERKIAGVIKAIEDGMYAPAMKTRMAELEVERTRVQALLAHMPAAEPVRLHPKLPEVYRKLVEELHRALNDPLIRDEASEALRALISRIVLTPQASGEGIDAILHGDVAAILEPCDRAKGKGRKGRPKKQHPGQQEPGCQLSVVAGARNHLYRTVVRWP